ncbi:hypothetical protein PQR75_00840 [Paraburkholderia fungorum]|uniref:hypothetical protein n=1 Tax=Paraburkholderia fungorum TaxID=134537 RepID=UPI0038B73A86
MAKKVTLDEGTFNATSHFSKEDGKSVLSSVTFEGAPLDANVLPSVDDFTRQSGNTEIYEKDPLEAKVSREGSHATLASTR